MTTNTKAIISSVAFFALVYAIFEYYTFTNGGSFDSSAVPGIITVGILLIIAIGVVSSIKYYREATKSSGGSRLSELDAEIKAYSMLADEQIKKNVISQTNKQEK